VRGAVHIVWPFVRAEPVPVGSEPTRCGGVLTLLTMWIVRLALRRPYTFIVLAVLIVL